MNELYKQFEKEMNKPGIVWGMPDYIKWLEKELNKYKDMQCKNCKHAKPDKYDFDWFCEMSNRGTSKAWFCADFKKDKTK